MRPQLPPGGCHELTEDDEPALPMERPAQPEEIAPAFVFFAAESTASYITGEVLGILGGETTAA